MDLQQFVFSPYGFNEACSERERIDIWRMIIGDIALVVEFIDREMAVCFKCHSKATNARKAHVSLAGLDTLGFSGRPFS